MKKNINANIIFVCIAAVIIFLIVLATSSSKNDSEVNSQTDATTAATPATTPDTTTPATVTPKPTGTPTTTTPGYTLAQVATHKDGKSCWTVVNGNVYDVTKWISQHPGGSRTILSMCGIDASSAFDDQHGGQRQPEKELASFKIGPLKK